MQSANRGGVGSSVGVAERSDFGAAESSGFALAFPRFQVDFRTVLRRGVVELQLLPATQKTGAGKPEVLGRFRFVPAKGCMRAEQHPTFDSFEKLIQRRRLRDFSARRAGSPSNDSRRQMGDVDDAGIRFL